MQEGIKVSQNKRNEISVYNDNLVNPKTIAASVAKLSIAFPKMSNDFFNLLAEMVVDEKFTENRMIDAVKHVIKNFQFKELNISDVVKFDRKIKLYTYNEVCSMVTSGKAVFDDFEIREVNGSCFRIMKKDLNV